MTSSELTTRECVESFDCFGSTCTVLVTASEPAARESVALARRWLLACHERFTRFDPASELSQLNGDRRRTVPVSPLMARFVRAAMEVAELTGGLVDPTLLRQIERVDDARSARRGRGRPDPLRRWRRIRVDPGGRTVSRPPGLWLDSGGLKGFFADLVAERLGAHESYAVDCGGDVRIGGVSRAPRPVKVRSPFDEAILHEFTVASGGVATSGIAKRRWTGANGQPVHHLLDPATGLPCFSGVVQATALAPTALHAEGLAKAALLSGPHAGERWLRFGGVLVYEDGGHHVVAPAARRVPADRLLRSP